jgi:hypothetical protein
MRVLTIAAFAIITLLGAIGDAAAMGSSNHRRYNGGGGEGGAGVQTTGLQIGPDAPQTQAVSVPEPGTVTLTALGLGAVAVFLRKARRRHVIRKKDGGTR